jgi:glycosyltransferase involved in cell wall biosynthesis
MACGVPVVATRSGGPEQILDERSGILVPVDDPGALAAGIERVALSRELARSLAQAGLQRVREHFSLRTMLSSYENLFSQAARANQ